MPRPAGSFRLSRFVLSAVLVLAASPAFAAQRTFVHSSPLGNDANTVANCSLVAPCRSFNAAISVTSPGGEVVILDTAGYGPMTITQSIKIIGPSGVYGGISVLGGGGPTTGVVINAGSTDVITLRGLDISGVPGGAPLPLIGIDIQNAGAVHIEKSSIGNFTQVTSACINVAPTTSTRVHINDSFLRECRTGINANGTGVTPPADGPSVIVDNTRIEVGYATSGPTWGVWVHGNTGVSFRNSLISILDVGIQMDNLPTNGNTVLELSQTKLVGMNTGLNVVSASTGGVPFVSITGSQFIGIDDAIMFSHTAPGTSMGAQLKITDSTFEQLSNGGITASAGADAIMNAELVRSQLSVIGNTAISLAASGTSRLSLDLRESTLSHAASTLLKTSGSSSNPILVSLIRSNLHSSFTAVDHGQGRIRMEQTNVNTTTNSLVNNGSGNIFSAGNNWIVDNADGTPGKIYITPVIIAPK